MDTSPMSENIIHPVFGTMTCNTHKRYVDCDGRLIVASDDIHFFIRAADRAAAVRLLDALAPDLRMLPDKITRAKAYAAQQLLKLKNDTWTEEDGTLLSEQDFIDRLTTDSVGIFADGLHEFGFDDGDLFFGHYVQVAMQGDGTFFDANFAG